jgi:hypothetical protein
MNLKLLVAAGCAIAMFCGAGTSTYGASTNEMIELLKTNDEKKVEEFYTANPDIVNKVIEFNGPPLFFCFRNKQIDDELKLDIVKFLIENGANASAADKKKQTPLKMVDKKSELFKAMKEAKKGKKK